MLIKTGFENMLHKSPSKHTISRILLNTRFVLIKWWKRFADILWQSTKFNTIKFKGASFISSREHFMNMIYAYRIDGRILCLVEIKNSNKCTDDKRQKEKERTQWTVRSGAASHTQLIFCRISSVVIIQSNESFYWSYTLKMVSAIPVCYLAGVWHWIAWVWARPVFISNYYCWCRFPFLAIIILVACDKTNAFNFNRMIFNMLYLVLAGSSDPVKFMAE